LLTRTESPSLSCVTVAGIPLANRTIDLAFGEKRAVNGVAMNTFAIDANNNITAFASLDEARAAKIHNAEYLYNVEPIIFWPHNVVAELKCLAGC
jgi:hypothetical protein